MNKKKIASISVSFSWVFMIIVGTVFLVMAYNIVGKYRAIEEQKYEFELKNAMRNVFNKIGQDDGITEQSLTPLGNIFADKEITFVCEQGFTFLSIDGELDNSNNFLENYPVFATKIGARDVSNTYIAVESFKLPFKITNMMALVSDKNMIIFDKNAEISKKLVKKFDRRSYSNLNYAVKEINSIYWSELQEFNLDSIIIVTDKSNVNSVSNLNNFNLEHVYIIGIEENENGKGKLQYYDKSKTPIESEYNYIDYDDSGSLQTMAIFSSPSVFDCSYKMINNAAQNAYEFYSQKAIKYSQLTTPACKTIEISEQKIKYEEFSKKLNEAKTTLENNGQVNKFMEKLTNLESFSEQMADFGCLYLY